MADDEVKKELDQEAAEGQEEQLEEKTEYELAEEKKKKLTYIIVFVVQIILAFVLIKFVIFPWYNNDGEEAYTEDVEEVENGEPIEIGYMYTISNLTVNPSGSRGRRFAVFEIALSVKTPEFVEEMKKYDTVIKDNYIQYLRSKTVEELSVDTAVVAIKNDLLDITGKIVGAEQLNDIYFTRFILQ